MNRMVSRLELRDKSMKFLGGLKPESLFLDNDYVIANDGNNDNYGRKDIFSVTKIDFMDWVGIGNIPIRNRTNRPNNVLNNGPNSLSSQPIKQSMQKQKSL